MNCINLIEDMVRTLDFHKIGQSWYADVPEWSGKLEDLEMVMGADTLLDGLSKMGRFVRIQVSTKEFEGSTHIRSNGKVYGGTAYVSVGYPVVGGANMVPELWLCSVNNFFWGGTENDEAPEDIYFKVIQFI